MNTQTNYTLGLALTDDDLRALGAIVAHWAVAETTMQSILLLMYTHPIVAVTDYPNEHIIAFKKKQEIWKKVVRLICQAQPEYLGIGISLASHGKIIKQKRDMACHWPGSRAVANPNNTVHFSNINQHTNGIIETEQFTTETLVSLSQEIRQWGLAIGMYGIIIGFELMPLSQYTPVGARPEWMLEFLRNYQKTIQTYSSSRVH